MKDSFLLICILSHLFLFSFLLCNYYVVHGSLKLHERETCLQWPSQTGIYFSHITKKLQSGRVRASGTTMPLNIHTAVCLSVMVQICHFRVVARWLMCHGHIPKRHQGKHKGRKASCRHPFFSSSRFLPTCHW